MGTGRWQIQLVEASEPPALVLWQPRPAPEPEPWQGESAPAAANMLPLLSALRHLAFRAGEPGAWGAPLAHDPIAFLLDSINDLVNVRAANGELVYSNRSAVDLGPLGPAEPGVTRFARGGRRFERRAVAFDAGGTTYVVEIVREIRNG